MNRLTPPFPASANGDVAQFAEPVEPTPGRNAPTPRLTQYFRILHRRRWAVLAVVALALMVGIAVTMMTTRQYVAVTTLEISREESRVVDIESVEPRSSAVDQEFYETQYGLL